MIILGNQLLVPFNEQDKEESELAGLVGFVLQTLDDWTKSTNKFL